MKKPSISASILRSVSLLALVGCAIVLARLLPVERGVQALRTWLEGAGAWGPAVFCASYLAAALLFVPGAALTPLAGLLFGILEGTVLVSIASTMAAAIGFVIARYLARDAVARLGKRNPRFGVIERAIEGGGWKWVALLRLSPVFPFSAGNYLFGLTSVRFGPYVVASWLFMLPGTFLYSYLGHVSGQGLAAAAGAHTRTAGEWAMLGVGLLATAIVVVYVTRIARRALDTRAPRGEVPPPETSPPRPVGTSILAAAAVLAVGVTGVAIWKRNSLRGIFGPPLAVLSEAYADSPDDETFDASVLDDLLQKHVDSDGWVDYAGLWEDREKLDAFLRAVAEASFDRLGRDERLAFLVNAYNACTLRLILDHWDGGKLQSIMDIPSDQRWDAVRWKVGGFTWSLNQMEHEQIRPKFREPRVHFALVCAAVGCPRLRNEAYRGHDIEKQLEDQATRTHQSKRWIAHDGGSAVVHLTMLYQWYGGDFEQVAGSVLAYVARYRADVKKALETGTPHIEWIPYDWKLNGRKNTK